MTAALRAVALALVLLMSVGQSVHAIAPSQERLPGFGGYCPLIVRPGEAVTFRVSVANGSPATARGTLTEIRLPVGLVLDEASVRAVPGAGAGPFAPRIAASASSGVAWASTDDGDAWRTYTLVVVARVAGSAVGEQLAVALSRDSAGNLIRRVDGVVYARSGGVRAQPVTTVVDMGVPEVCAVEPTPTATATPTPTPTATPIPPPYYAKRLSLADVEGTGFSLAVVCVIDSGRSANRSPAPEYRVAFDLPASARVALAFGANPNIASDGRTARFTVRPGDSAVRVAIVSRPAAGEPVWRAPISPVIRVSADGFGDLAERAAEPGSACDADPALLPALVAAERAGQSSRALANAGAVAVATEPPASSPATPPTTVSTPGPAIAGSPTLVSGSITPTRAASPASGDVSEGDILPDPRSVMLPLMCGMGVALAALALAYLGRRRSRDEL